MVAWLYFFGSCCRLDGNVWHSKHAHLMVARKRNSGGMDPIILHGHAPKDLASFYKVPNSATGCIPSAYGP